MVVALWLTRVPVLYIFLLFCSLAQVYLSTPVLCIIE